METENKPGYLTIFVGEFDNKDAFEKYTEEFYSDRPETDHLPINKFAEDIGTRSYDHDFAEIVFTGMVLDWEIELLKFSYGKSYAEEVGRIINENKGIKPNAVFIFVNTEYKPKEIKNKKLKYIGVFKFNERL
jgi:Immunity protein 22